MIKKINTYAPVIGLLFAFSAGVVSVYAAEAVDNHNDNDRAHPEIVSRIDKDASELILLAQRLHLTQDQNVLAHNTLEKKQDRIILILDRLEGKIDNL